MIVRSSASAVNPRIPLSGGGSRSLRRRRDRSARLRASVSVGQRLRNTSQLVDVGRRGVEPGEDGVLGRRCGDPGLVRDVVDPRPAAVGADGVAVRPRRRRHRRSKPRPAATPAVAAAAPNEGATREAGATWATASSSTRPSEPVTWLSSSDSWAIAVLSFVSASGTWSYGLRTVGLPYLARSGVDLVERRLQVGGQLRVGGGDQRLQQVEDLLRAVDVAGQRRQVGLRVAVLLAGDLASARPPRSARRRRWSSPAAGW